MAPSCEQPTSWCQLKAPVYINFLCSICVTKLFITRRSWEQHFQVKGSFKDNDFKSNLKQGHIYHYHSILNNIFKYLALTVFEEMRGQHEREIMFNNTCKREMIQVRKWIFKYQVGAKKLLSKTSFLNKSLKLMEKWLWNNDDYQEKK